MADVHLSRVASTRQPRRATTGPTSPRGGSRAVLRRRGFGGFDCGFQTRRLSQTPSQTRSPSVQVRACFVSPLRGLRVCFLTLRRWRGSSTRLCRRSPNGLPTAAEATEGHTGRLEYPSEATNRVDLGWRGTPEGTDAGLCPCPQHQVRPALSGAHSGKDFGPLGTVPVERPFAQGLPKLPLPELGNDKSVQFRGGFERAS